MMPTIRVIRVDYADGSWYQDFKVFNTDDFIKFILSHHNYDFHIRALNAVLSSASGNPYVGVQLYLGK